MPSYTYIIVGGGLAGVHAVEGIRERDPEGSILLVSREPDPPYDRPPLSKKLWLGKKQVQDIFVHDADYYRSHGVDLRLRQSVLDVQPKEHSLRLDTSERLSYEKLLLATGAEPRHLTLPGADADALLYYRTLTDFHRANAVAAPGRTAVVIGGGFIGSEMAAVLRQRQLNVHMIFPEPLLVMRVFPEGLGRALHRVFLERGVLIHAGDKPTAFEPQGNTIRVRTQQGLDLAADLVVIGVGVLPSTELAAAAQLDVDNGIVVNAYLQTSDPDIFAAGDVARFPSALLGQSRRVEHWDNAVEQGKAAGRNMAGARAPYTHEPYFFSDLFEFGFEAVGQVDTKLQTVAVWEKENEQGVVYYLADHRVRGVMLCNIWEKIDWARELIRRGETVTPESLRGAVRPA